MTLVNALATLAEMDVLAELQRLADANADANHKPHPDARTTWSGSFPEWCFFLLPAPRPDQAFALADRNGVLLRADKAAVHGMLHLDDARDAVLLNQEFEGMWQRSPASVSATTLGL